MEIIIGIGLVILQIALMCLYGYLYHNFFKNWKIFKRWEK